ncbi:MAG: phosphate acyltransferase PlsX [Chloroflexota bacterium]
MRIVVDAMGSDTCPGPDVAGAVLAAREHPENTIILVGQEDAIFKELDQYKSPPSNLETRSAEHVILMTDRPAVASKEKPGSSMHVGMKMVHDGEADAFVTVGNTGAAHAIAMLFTLKRIPGVKRPALSIIFPIHGKPVIFADVGANADSKAEWLAQFAIMGSIYAHHVLKIPSPRVGLLSNGEEEGKGTQIVIEAHHLIQKTSLNYIGNIEPADMHNSVADVVISDGFTGNIMLKTFESSTRYLSNIIRSEVRSSILSTLGGLLLRPVFKRVRARIDPAEIGGAPLLGVNGVVIIGHGNSEPRAIKNAIIQAQKAVEANVIKAITQEFANLRVGVTE